MELGRSLRIMRAFCIKESCDKTTATQDHFLLLGRRAVGNHFCIPTVRCARSLRPAHEAGMDLQRPASSEKACHCNSLVNSKGFLRAFAKRTIGVKKTFPGTGPPLKLPKIAIFDKGFVIKMEYFLEALFFRFLPGAGRAPHLSPLRCVFEGL